MTSSSTRTQSWSVPREGGVKSREPSFGKVPISVADPVRGSNHQAAASPHAIVDMGTTTVPHMTRILDDIDAALADGGTAYVHCWGGIGRTGTVVGCWLVRHGLDRGDPIATIARLRRAVLDSFMPSPQTTAQRAMVTGWRRGR